MEGIEAQLVAAWQDGFNDGYLQRQNDIDEDAAALSATSEEKT